MASTSRCALEKKVGFFVMAGETNDVREVWPGAYKTFIDVGPAAQVQMRDGLPQIFRFIRNMRLCGVIGVLLIAPAGSPIFAGEFIYYTNTCVEQESGDVAGYVVILSDSEPLPSISLSWSEGALMLPVAAKITDYDRMSGRLTFSVHIEWGDSL